MSGKHRILLSLLIDTYSFKGQANQLLHNYNAAMGDYNRLIQLAQYQNVDTDKLREYMALKSDLRQRIRQKTGQRCTSPLSATTMHTLM